MRKPTRLPTTGTTEACLPACFAVWLCETLEVCGADAKIATYTYYTTSPPQ